MSEDNPEYGGHSPAPATAPSIPPNIYHPDPINPLNAIAAHLNPMLLDMRSRVAFGFRALSYDKPDGRPCLSSLSESIERNAQLNTGRLYETLLTSPDDSRVCGDCARAGREQENLVRRL